MVAGCWVWFQKFYQLFFFSAQTLTTVGYGHIYPNSVFPERFLYRIYVRFDGFCFSDRYFIWSFFET
ncbi:MAG: hypothetical protein IPH32_10885 [Bacteroidetes bacterium]|nr:hypothetical protein [Bacteroidota bacterium]